MVCKVENVVMFVMMKMEIYFKLIRAIAPKHFPEHSILIIFNVDKVVDIVFSCNNELLMHHNLEYLPLKSYGVPVS